MMYLVKENHYPCPCPGLAGPVFSRSLSILRMRKRLITANKQLLIIMEHQSPMQRGRRGLGAEFSHAH